jgi:hypothetical protein
MTHGSTALHLACQQDNCKVGQLLTVIWLLWSFVHFFIFLLQTSDVYFLTFSVI